MAVKLLPLNPFEMIVTPDVSSICRQVDHMPAAP